jgi:beta-galactosidase/beta-glucuronidase
VLIPEPNLWAPEHPYRYEGPVEFWLNGEMIDQITVSIGIR